MKRLWLVAMAALVASCVGEIDDTLPILPEECRSTASLLPAIGVRRLTRSEYRNTIRDVLGVTPPDVTALPEDAVLRSFTTTIGQSMNAAAAGRYIDAAELVATRLLTDKPPACGDDACVRGYLAQLGARLIRRPLSADEAEHFMGQYAQARTAGDDMPTSVGVAVAAMLASPQFLFVHRAGPYGVASHLAYSLWQTAPDDELVRAATEGKLATREGIALQVDRLARDPRAHETLRNFVEQWLGVELIAKVNVQQAYPDATPEVLAALSAETRASIEDVLANDRDYRKLFVSNRVFRNRVLSAFYDDGLATGDEMQAFDVPPTEKRFGLLSQAGVVMAASRNEHTSIIYRGKYVRTRLLCGDIELPPAGLPTGLPDVNPYPTSRERISQHTSPAVCQGCHVQLNPLGFTMLHFDGSGRWQDDEHGAAIDASASVEGLGDIDGAYALSRALADSAEAATCVAETVVTMARAERLGDDDLCVAAAFGEHFARSGYDIASLMAAVVREQAYAMLGATP